MLKSILALTFLMALTDSAFAYLDPGTSSIILQAILGFIAALGETITLYWNKLKVLLKKIFKKKSE